MNLWKFGGSFLLLISWMFVAGNAWSASPNPDLERRVQALEERFEEQDNEIRVYFDNGFKMKSRDAEFKFQVGGRIQADGAFLDGDSAFEKAFRDPPNGAEIRRARLFMAGLLYHWIYFKAQFDFVGQTSFNDVYLRFTKLPLVGNFQVGHFKEPFSLEGLASTKHHSFMERSLMSLFSPARNLGLALFNHSLGGRMTWAVGVFRPTGSSPPRIQDDDGANVTFRITALPLYRDQGIQLVHTGFSFSHVTTPPSGTVRFRSKPEANLLPFNTLDTGTVKVRHMQLYNFEFASVFNSFSLQGEYVLAHLDTVGFGGSDLYGFYAQAGYFLTGERRNFKRKSAVFSRIKPRRNFLYPDEGPGAWEIAVRYSHADLRNGSVSGGNEGNLTLGLNWFMNPLTRVTFNYVWADVESGAGKDAGNLHVYQFRFQVEF